MATGDLKNNLRKLQFELRAVKYDHDADIESLGRGVPVAFLPIYHYAFVEYSHPLAEKILEIHFEMYSKTDLRFIETMYKVLRELFGYKPTITKEQFFNPGFGERKVMMCCEILRLVQDMHRKLVGNKPPIKSLKSGQRTHSASESFACKPSHSEHISETSMMKMSEPSALGEASLLDKNPRVMKHVRSSTSSEFMPWDCLSCGADSLKSSSLVPVVINEASGAAPSELLRSFNDANKVKAKAEKTSGSGGRGGVFINSESMEGEIGRLPDRVDHDMRVLNETRLNNHQALISNISEKLAEITSKVVSLESRLNGMDSLASRLSLSSNVVSSSAPATACDPQKLERSFENVVARLTLVENRLNILEKQGKLCSLSLDNCKTGDVVNRDLLDEEALSPVALSWPTTSATATGATGDHRTISRPLDVATETRNIPARLQSKRIEAMLQETGEMLMKKSGHSS